MKLRSILIGAGLLGLASLIGCNEELNIKRQRFDNCVEKIFRNFDENNNRVLEGKEVSKLAKMCGYHKVMPLGNPLVKIEPARDDFKPRVFDGTYAIITFSAYGTNVSGFAHGEIQWQKFIRVSEQTLKNLANYGGSK